MGRSVHLLLAYLAHASIIVRSLSYAAAAAVRTMIYAKVEEKGVVYTPPRTSAAAAASHLSLATK